MFDLFTESIGFADLQSLRGLLRQLKHWGGPKADDLCAPKLLRNEEFIFSALWSPLWNHSSARAPSFTSGLRTFNICLALVFYSKVTLFIYFWKLKYDFVFQVCWMNLIATQSWRQVGVFKTLSYFLSSISLQIRPCNNFSVLMHFNIKPTF